MAPPPLSLLDLPPELVQLVADALVSSWVRATKADVESAEGQGRALRIAKEHEAGRTVCAMLAFRATCKRGYALVKPWTAPKFCNLLGMEDGMDPRYAKLALGHLLLWKQTRVPKMNHEQHMHVLSSCTAAMSFPYCWDELVGVAPRGAAGPQPHWAKVNTGGTLKAKKKWRALGMSIINTLMQECAEAWTWPYANPDRMAQERREREDRARRAVKLVEYADRHNNSVLFGSARSLRTHYELRKHELNVASFERQQHIAQHGFESS